MRTPKTKIDAIKMLLEKADGILAGDRWSFHDPRTCPLCLYDSSQLKKGGYKDPIRGKKGRVK